MTVHAYRPWAWPLGSRLFAAVGLGCLAGCSGAPSLTIAGAFFPAWLACALLGLLASLLARIVFVMTGLSQTLPLQFFVCLALGALVGALAWAFWIGI